MRGWPTPGRRRKRACSATPLRGLGRGGATRPSELLGPLQETFRGDPGPPSRHGSVQDIQKA
ncbi:hypothetical protein M885DRAFT_553561, partial [Pelagophyceae sp. CCMP2097]